MSLRSSISSSPTEILASARLVTAIAGGIALTGLGLGGVIGRPPSALDLAVGWVVLGCGIALWRSPAGVGEVRDAHVDHGPRVARRWRPLPRAPRTPPARMAGWPPHLAAPRRDRIRVRRRGARVVEPRGRADNRLRPRRWRPPASPVSRGQRGTFDAGGCRRPQARSPSGACSSSTASGSSGRRTDPGSWSSTSCSSRAWWSCSRSTAGGGVGARRGDGPRGRARVAGRRDAAGPPRDRPRRPVPRCRLRTAGGRFRRRGRSAGRPAA